MEPSSPTLVSASDVMAEIQRQFGAGADAGLRIRVHGAQEGSEARSLRSRVHRVRRENREYPTPIPCDAKLPWTRLSTWRRSSPELRPVFGAPVNCADVNPLKR